MRAAVMTHAMVRLRAPMFAVFGALLLLAALADVRAAWLTSAAERLRGAGGLSLITVRALWLVRVWLGTVGAWLLWVEWVRRREWAPPAGDDTPLWVWPSAVVLGLLVWTLPLGFVGDDFLWLDAWARDGLRVVRPDPGAPHYIPLGLVLCNLPQAMFGFTPLAYRVVTIVLHGAAAGLVALAARTAGLRPGLAAGAGAVFASTALAYEPLLWATGQFYLWPGVLVAGVLAAVAAGPESVGVRRAWGIGVAGALGGFLIEQAAGLTLFVLWWSTVGAGRRCERRARLPLIACPLIGAAALLLLRAGTRPPGDALVSGAQFLRNIDHVLGGMVMANSPAGHMLGGWLATAPVPRLLGAGLAVAIVAALWWRTGEWGRTLLAVWVALWLPALLFAPQSSRYWYLPAIPAAVGAVHGVAAFEARLERTGRGAMWPAGAGAIVAWVGLGAVAMGLRVPDWREANTIARAVEHDVVMLTAARHDVRRIVIAGVPDGVGTDLWPAYVFNNGLAEAVAHARPADGAWAGRIETLPGPYSAWPGPYTARGGPPVPVEALDAAAATPGVKAMLYEPALPGVVLWSAPAE